MARVVAVLLGYDHLPGATVTRYCSSSLQTTRMAFHAIKAGEGDVFISAGVEMRVPLRPGQLRRPAARGAGAGRRRLGEPALRRRRRRAPSTRRGRRPTLARPARRTASCPTSTWRWGRPRRTSPRSTASPARTWTSSASAVAEPGREGHRGRLLGPRDHPGDHCPTAPWSAPTTARGPGVTLEAVSGLKPVFRPDGRITAGNCCPLNDGAAAVVIMSDDQGPRAGHHPAGPDRLHRRHRAVPGDHGARPGRGVPAGARAGPA